MRAKRAKAAKMVYNANIYLMQYGRHRDAAINVARQLLADAERRIENGFGPVPRQDCENLLEIERKYVALDPSGLLVIE